MAEPEKERKIPGSAAPEKPKGKPKVELFSEFEMTFDNRCILKKMNKFILALDVAGIIEAVTPERKKDIPDAMGVGSKDIKSGV